MNEKKMKIMGYHYKVCFIRPNGVPFHKYFSTKSEMDAFMVKAIENGMKIK